MRDFIIYWGWIPALILGSIVIWIRELPRTHARVVSWLTIPYVILLIIYAAYAIIAGLLDPMQGRP